MAPPKVLGALVIWSLLGNPARAADVAPAADARLPTASATTTPIRPTSLDADEWTVTAAAGPVIATLASPSAGPWPLSFALRSTAWQVELQRRSSHEPFVLGVTLEGTHDQTGGQQMLGVDVFVGTTWRHRHWSLEMTAGGGLEAAQFPDYNVSYQLGVYAQGAVTAAVSVSSSLEVLLRLGAHLTATHDEDWFAASTIGLRYTLP